MIRARGDGHVWIRLTLLWGVCGTHLGVLGRLPYRSFYTRSGGMLTNPLADQYGTGIVVHMGYSVRDPSTVFG